MSFRTKQNSVNISLTNRKVLVSGDKGMITGCQKCFELVSFTEMTLPWCKMHASFWPEEHFI